MYEGKRQCSNCIQLSVPTERYVCLSQYLRDPQSEEEPLQGRVEADHEVEDPHIEGGLDQEHGELSQLLGQEVHVGPIHPIEMFPQEDWQLHAEDVHHGDQHVVDVGDHEEEGPVDAGHPGSGVLLSEEYGSQYQRDHLLDFFC